VGMDIDRMKCNVSYVLIVDRLINANQLDADGLMTELMKDRVYPDDVIGDVRTVLRCLL